MKNMWIGLVALTAAALVLGTYMSIAPTDGRPDYFAALSSLQDWRGS